MPPYGPPGGDAEPAERETSAKIPAKLYSVDLTVI
jgi:hypothetical protein